MNQIHQSRRQHLARLTTRFAAVTLLMVGGFALKGHPVSAATENGVATISDPGSAQPLASGGSATVFTVALPTAAACSGDTANKGFHIYSYLIPTGTNIASVTFVNSPSTGGGLFDTSGNYYGSVNTAINTGQIIGIPTNFAWAGVVTGGTISLPDLLGGGTTATWHTGLVCADTNGKVTDWWNTDVTFTGAAADANGFTWTATPGGSAGGTPTTTTTVKKVTTTTKAPKKTTTTTSPKSTPTTTASGSTTTTAFSTDPGTTVPVSGSGFVDTSGTDGTLPRTGSPIHRDFALGLFAIGAGMMLIGVDWRWKARGVIAS